MSYHSQHPEVGGFSYKDGLKVATSNIGLKNHLLSRILDFNRQKCSSRIAIS